MTDIAADLAQNLDEIVRAKSANRRLTVMNGIYIYTNGSFYIVSSSGYNSILADVVRNAREQNKSIEEFVGSKCVIDRMLDECDDHSITEITPDQIKYAGIIWKRDINITLPMNEEKLLEYYKKRIAD